MKPVETVDYPEKDQIYVRSSAITPYSIFEYSCFRCIRRVSGNIGVLEGKSKAGPPGSEFSYWLERSRLRQQLGRVGKSTLTRVVRV